MLLTFASMDDAAAFVTHANVQKEALDDAPVDEPALKRRRLDEGEAAPPAPPVPEPSPTALAPAPARIILPPTTAKYSTVTVAPEHSDKRVSVKGRTVANQQGFRSARSSHGTCTGAWYWEVSLTATPIPNAPDPHWRLGVATGYATIGAPVGADQHGYGYRDVDGSKLHRAKRTPYGAPFGAGDIIGVLLTLPETAPSSTPLPPPCRDVWLPPVKLELPDFEGSSLSFFVNGRPQGVSHEPLSVGRYFPTVSLYYGAEATFNFGPTFDFPPQGNYKPYCYVPASAVIEGGETAVTDRMELTDVYHDPEDLSQNATSIV